MAYRPPTNVGLKQQWSIGGQHQVPAKRRKGREGLIVSPPRKPDALCPMRNFESDQVRLQQARILIDGSRGVRDGAGRNVDSALNPAVTR